ncbi:hypothetical protein [Providencia sp. PROV007]|uniref:hypothetical protein n=1 Tax=Providencia sp. PROV007 TaxID=2936770 RepID=UPI00299050D0|nr:hypothetical protein [Providencia sp. PROV007]
MSKPVTTEMLNDEGIRSALELLQEQVDRFEAESRRYVLLLEKGRLHINFLRIMFISLLAYQSG